MGLLTRIGEALADYIDRRPGHPFTQTSTPGATALALVSSPAADLSPAVAGQAVETPEDSATSGVSRHLHPAGSDLHAEGCLYTRFPEHRCVATDGQPTTAYCWASMHATARKDIA